METSEQPQQKLEEYREKLNELNERSRALLNAHLEKGSLATKQMEDDVQQLKEQDEPNTTEIQLEITKVIDAYKKTLAEMDQQYGDAWDALEAERKKLHSTFKEGLTEPQIKLW